MGTANTSSKLTLIDSGCWALLVKIESTLTSEAATMNKRFIDMFTTSNKTGRHYKGIHCPDTSLPAPVS